MENNFHLIPLEQKLNATNIISLFHYKYPLNYYFEGERHNFWEFVFVDQGSLEITAGDKIHILKEGEIIFHQPNEFHALKTCSNKSSSAIICSFTCEESEMKFFRKFKTTLISANRDLLLKLLSLRSSLFFNDSIPFHSVPKSTQQISIHCKQLVKNYIEIFLLSIIAKNTNQSVDTSGNIINSLTQNIIVFLKQNIYKKLSLEEISIAVGYSIPHMKRLFHNDMKQGIIDYFVKLKIDEAKKMIDNNVSLSEIASSLNFNDLAYFCRKFKQYEGITPSEYRRNSHY